MCGIFGYSSKEKFDVDKMRVLMYINSIERGTDSTGFYSPINQLKKSLKAGWVYCNDNKDEIKPDTIFMGHVRASTVGSSVIGNAHPFERGSFVLA